MAQKPVSTDEEKVDWLVANPWAWKTTFDAESKATWRRIVHIMKDAGLYAPSTYYKDTRLDDLVAEALRRLEPAK